MFNECDYLKNNLDREDIHAATEQAEIYDKQFQDATTNSFTNIRTVLVSPA